MKRLFYVFILMTILTACGLSKPSGKEYVGKWNLSVTCWTGSQSECEFDISKMDKSFVIKKVAGTCAQSCNVYEGIFSLTPEGNLKGGPMGMLVLSFDEAKNQILASGGGSLEYLRKIQ